MTGTKRSNPKRPALDPFKWLTRGLAAAVIVAAGLFGYSLLRADLAADVYLGRLHTLAGDYERLRGTFNEVVSKTAVTELVVEDGSLSVHIRDASGRVRKIPTPYDPAGEIYVDFVVADGRLLIRRLFDEATRPADAMVIDERLADIDWGSGGGARLGKAVYRALGQGRWGVTVTANGSLDLVSLPGRELFELVSAPPLRDYEEIQQEAAREIREIGPADVIRRVLYGKPDDGRPSPDQEDR